MFDFEPRLMVPVGERDHIQGRFDAPVTLVEYGDYACPDCAATYPLVKDNQALLCDRLRFVWRNFPQEQIHRQAGNPAEAIGALRQALRLDPDQQPILSSLGWCLAHAGQHHEALGVLEKALVIDPLDATAWAAKGWSLACLKRLHEALRALEEATGLDPQNAEAWRTRGWCLERLGLEGEALRAFKQAQRAG